MSMVRVAGWVGPILGLFLGLPLVVGEEDRPTRAPTRLCRLSLDSFSMTMDPLLSSGRGTSVTLEDLWSMWVEVVLALVDCRDGRRKLRSRPVIVGVMSLCEYPGMKISFAQGANNE